MSEPASNFLVLIVKKIADSAREKQWLKQAAEWLGLVSDDDSDYKEEERQEYQDENYSLKKWSTSWIAHRMQPANKIAWSVIGLFVIGIWFNLDEVLPSYVFRLPVYSIALFGVWATLRWLSRNAKPQSAPIARTLKLQARGAFWWGMAMLAYYALISIVLWVNSLFV